MFVKDKVALITGGVSGLGLSFVREFLKNGVKAVTLVDINVKRGEELIPQLEQEFGPKKAIFLKADVTDRTEFEDTFKKTIEIFKQLDIVINCGGITDEQNFKKVVDVNLNGVITGTYLALDEYLPNYKTSEYGVVINIASIYGLDGAEVAAAYTAAKHGVVGLGKSFSTKFHYEATSVKILTICPGFTETRLITDPEKFLLPGRYVSFGKELLSRIYYQKPEAVSKALMKILENFESGDVWLVENDECHLLEIPQRTSLKKIKTIDI